MTSDKLTCSVAGGIGGAICTFATSEQASIWFNEFLWWSVAGMKNIAADNYFFRSPIAIMIAQMICGVALGSITGGLQSSSWKAAFWGGVVAGLLAHAVLPLSSGAVRE